MTRIHLHLATLLITLLPLASVAEEINMQRAKEIMQKKQLGQTLTADEEAYLQRTREEMQKRRAGANGGGVPFADPKIVAALVPLDELKGAYKGEDGGLYGGGKNTPPEAHAEAYREETKKIHALDAEGKPSVDGKIVLLSLGMSNTTQEFSEFVKMAGADSKKSTKLVVVDGAIGARPALIWALDGADLFPGDEQARLQKNREKISRQGKSPGDSWSTVEMRLKQNGVTPQQVQLMWIKQAEAQPAAYGEFPEHARVLETDLIDILNIAKHHYPNLRVAYLSSRIFGGYATSSLNPEPYAYEEAFSMRWLIQKQIKGDPRLNYNPKRGEVKAPLAVWGPYLWANGRTPRRSDGLVWNEEDFVTTDHTHPSTSGRQKVVALLLKFFQTDENAGQWYLKPGV